MGLRYIRGKGKGWDLAKGLGLGERESAVRQGSGGSAILVQCGGREGAPNTPPERSLWRHVGRFGDHTDFLNKSIVLSLALALCVEDDLKIGVIFLDVLPPRQSLHPHTTLLLDHYLYRGETSS